MTLFTPDEIKRLYEDLIDSFNKKELGEITPEQFELEQKKFKSLLISDSYKKSCLKLTLDNNGNIIPL